MTITPCPREHVADLAIERDDLSQINAPEQVALAAVASAERLLGRPLERVELLEMRMYYGRVLLELEGISESRFPKET